MNGNVQNDFSNRREALRKERGAIAVEIARLQAQDEMLIREEERLDTAQQALADEPYLVNARWLIDKLSLPESTFWRLVKNEAKGFPKAVYGIDSKPRWVWPQVKAWLSA